MTTMQIQMQKRENFSSRQKLLFSKRRILQIERHLFVLIRTTIFLVVQQWLHFRLLSRRMTVCSTSLLRTELWRENCSLQLRKSTVQLLRELPLRVSVSILKEPTAPKCSKLQTLITDQRINSRGVGNHSSLICRLVIYYKYENVGYNMS